MLTLAQADEDFDVGRPAKKPRGGRKSAPKSVYRSPIAGILDALDDELLERCLGLCDPRDLLAVARASKRCYAFVMDEARGHTLFKEAFDHIRDEYEEWPPCPPSMTLPQWTAMLWPEACSVRRQRARTC